MAAFILGFALLITLAPAALHAEADRQCVVCHQDSAEKPDPSRLHASMLNCSACHGASAAHLQLSEDGQRPPPDDDGAGTCLACHEGPEFVHFTASAHERSATGCATCHSAHQPDPMANDSAQIEQCLSCHRDVRADLKRRSAHPIGESGQSCTSCHAPHGGKGPAGLKAATLNESCYACHAETRGPFLFEHAPVREDCSNCHRAHGANHEDLLVTRTPFLCQQCHSARFHPSTLIDGSQHPPEGASHLALGKDCMNCHANVHGSNHPSGGGLIR